VSHKKRPEYTVGVILLVIAATTYSTAGLFTKGVEAGPWEVIFWRGIFAGALTTVWTIKRGAFRDNFFHMGHSGWAVAVVGASGTVAFIPAFKLTSIANVSLIYAVSPCLTSAPLGHLSLFLNGGFGSSRFDVKPLVVDGSSGGF